MTELIVDNFAGGGGASTGIYLATGRHPDIAINHDPEALAMHAANHPTTKHYCESVWEVNPRELADGRPVGLVWLSPDCKHFSKAKGGQPVEKKIRGLAWVALRWAATVRPRIIMLENVEEFVTWGPLAEGPDGKLRPCPKRKGREFASFTNALSRQGYRVEYRELRACDYGAPTIRKRLFLVARRDGLPIVWPAPTHGDPASESVKNGQLLPWRTAAECIDWSLPCPSIFERKKPLADATLRRIAKGVMRYVVQAAEPFIVPVMHHGDSRVHGIGEPLRTVTSAHRGELALVSPSLMVNTTGHSGAPCNSPLHTVATGGHHALVSAFLTRYYNNTTSTAADPRDPLPTVTAWDHNALVTANLVHMGHGEQSANGAKRWSHGVRDIEAPLNTVAANGVPAGLVAVHLTKFRAGSVGSSPDEPIHTITAGGTPARASTGNVHGVITSSLIKLRGDNTGHAADEPLHTISAQGQHFAEVRAFLVKYYGTDQDPQLIEPLHTVTTKPRFGLVTVAGEEYAIADIGLRMLQPRELFRAQGFPDSYVIGDNPAQGLKLTKEAQVRMCGNSVCPPVAAALVKANYLNESSVTHSEAIHANTHKIPRSRMGADRTGKRRKTGREDS